VARLGVVGDEPGERVTIDITDVREINVDGLIPHPHPAAANMPIVRGVCPACGMQSLFLAVGGWVTCVSLRCPNPSAASEALDPNHLARSAEFHRKREAALVAAAVDRAILGSKEGS